MRSKLSHHIVSALISCCILVVGVGGFLWLFQKPKAPAAEAPRARAPVVTTIPLEPHTSRLQIAVDGSVVPFREISTSAEVAGRVIFKAAECDAGNFVSAGTRLLQIDPQDYELQALQLTHQLREADASIEELSAEITNTKKLIELAREDLGLQQRELARMTNLAQSNVVTESDLDRTRQAELAARNALAVLENQLNLQTTRSSRLDASRKFIEAQLEKAKLDIQRTEIVAVTDGVIVQDLVEQGDYVQKGESLVMLEDTSAVEVMCSLQMDELYWLWRGRDRDASQPLQPAGRYQIPQAPVTVSYQLPQSDIRYEWRGTLSRYDGIGLDERTRTVPCRVHVNDPLNVRVVADRPTTDVGPPALVRGMYVDVKIELTGVGELVRIPEYAIRPGKVLWVARGSQLRVIKTLRLISLADPEPGTESRYWIADATASRLLPEDQIVVSTLTAVTDGMPIELEESP